MNWTSWRRSGTTWLLRLSCTKRTQVKSERNQVRYLDELLYLLREFPKRANNLSIDYYQLDALEEFSRNPSKVFDDRLLCLVLFIQLLKIVHSPVGRFSIDAVCTASCMLGRADQLTAIYLFRAELTPKELHKKMVKKLVRMPALFHERMEFSVMQAKITHRVDDWMLVVNNYRTL